MVAKRVKRATAPTRTCCEWEVQTETTEEEDPKKMGRVLKLCRVRNGGEGTAGEGASLGLEQGLAGWGDGGLEFIVVGCVERTRPHSQLQ